MSQIPNKKHTDQELAGLRAKSAMTTQAEAPMVTYDKKLASKPIVFAGYFFALAAPAWLILRKIAAPLGYSMTDIYIMAGCILISIIIALFIIATRSLSRHHGCFIVIVALLCSFSVVYVLNTDRDVLRETMAIFGRDIPQDTAPEIKSNISDELQELDRMIEAERNKP